MMSRKNTLPKVLITLSLALSAPVTWGKTVGTYTATLMSTNNMGGQWNNLGLALLGWSCTGSEQIHFYENLLDHKGRVNPVQQNEASNFSFSAFMMSQPVNTVFQRDMKLPGARLELIVRENCEKQVTDTEWVTDRDSDGNTTTRLETTTRTINAWMEWSCDTSRLPETPGQRIQSVCSPSNSYFGEFSLEALMVNMFRHKTFDLTMGLEAVDEKFVVDLCSNPNDPNRVIIALKQGVGGHSGEDDFQFDVTIDGKHNFKLGTSHGILNEEIAYCGAGTAIAVDVSAKELDLFFDDVYTPTAGVKFQRDLGRTDVLQEARVGLRRGTYFGELFTDKTSEVLVTLREAGGVVRQLGSR